MIKNGGLTHAYNLSHANLFSWDPEPYPLKEPLTQIPEVVAGEDKASVSELGPGSTHAKFKPRPRMNRSAIEGLKDGTLVMYFYGESTVY